MDMLMVSFIYVGLYCVIYFQCVVGDFIDMINSLVVFLCVVDCEGEVCVF